MEGVACPLCCEDKFPNQDLLKYHLLSITTNVQCPFCEKRCDDINALILHLDKMCVDNEEVIEKADNEIIVVYPDIDDSELEIGNGDNDALVKEVDYQLDETQTDSNADTETDIEQFIEEFTVDDSAKTIQTSETESQEELHDLYHCSECNINFPSIGDHINECHKGQEVEFQVTKCEDTNVSLKNLADINDKHSPQTGTWIKWGNGYFYTNYKDVVMENLDENHLCTDIKSEETKTLKHIPEDVFQEMKKCANKELISCVNQIDTNISVKTANLYSNHSITDSYGDRYFDIPIHLLNQTSEKVNDYFQVEAHKLSHRKRICLIRLKSANDHFVIEQILFQNKPTNCNIIPVLEQSSEYNEYLKLDNLDNCLLLTWRCLVCNIKSDHWSKLNKHNCKKNELKIPKTKKKLDTENPALKNNYQSVSTTRPQHICPHCSGEFDSEGYLRTHILVHANDLNKCEICDQPIAPEMMETHLLAHQNPEFSNLKFLCKICNKCYDSDFRLQCHQRAHEMNRKPREVLVCDICNAQFNDKNSLKHHAITHIEPPERLRRLHECRFCGKTFVKPIEKVNHERVHTGEKPFACPVCGRCFRLKDLVHKHMRVHTKERPYKCRHEGCEKTFGASSNRLNHEQCHSDIKQFKCIYCPKYFKNWVSRSNHVQEHKVQHKCEICYRSFVSFYNYKKHLKMHADGRLKFKCIICCQAFGRQLLLDNHLNSEH